MRWLALTLFTSVLVAGGCATASSGPSMSPRTRSQQRTLHANVAKTDALVRELRTLNDAQLTGDEGRDSVIALARAQTCVAVHSGSADVAERTVNLLDHYEQLHIEAHGSAERWGRRRIRVARRDAEIAAQPGSVLMLPCTGNIRRSRWGLSRSDAVRQAWGIDTPASLGTDGTRSMVPGGVVR